MLAAGKSAEKPPVLIENGTLPSQREVFAPLAELNQSVMRANISGPSIIIIGKAVEIAQQAQQLLMQHDAEESLERASVRDGLHAIGWTWQASNFRCDFRWAAAEEAH